MPGFFIANKTNLFSINKHDDFFSLQYSCLKNDDYLIERNTIEKFMNDKVFEENNNYIVILEGVILNKDSLISKYKQESFFNTIIKMYETFENTFMKKLRGSFSGALYIKKERKWLFFTNHVGDKPVFYFFNKQHSIISSSLEYLVSYLNSNNILYSINENSCYDLLTYGYLVSGGGRNSVISDVFRLNPGEYLEFKDGQHNINVYHTFKNDSNKYLVNKSEDEIIDELDSLFKKAIQLEFDKDKEYGYQHLVSLSGGLDSRMTNWVANKMNYRDIINMTFSQSNYLDDLLSKEIAKYLHHELLFKSLDDANFLKANQFITKYSYGTCSYNLIAHSYSMMKYMNFKTLGLLHTGQLGDVIVNCCEKESIRPADITAGMYSKRLANKVHVKSKDNCEIFYLYNRGFHGALASHIFMQNYTEIVSPFMDVDFFEYCLKIPFNLRKNNYIYKKWILSKYPDAAKFKWEKICGKITDSKIRLLINKIRMKGFKNCFNYLCKKINKNVVLKEDDRNMNPYNYWYNNNLELKAYLDELFFSIDETEAISRELKEDLKELYKSGDASEKLQVISVISVLRQYF